MSGNEQRGTHERDHWWLFDRLPAPLQDLLRYADSNYKAGWVLDNVSRFGLARGYSITRDRLQAERRADLVRFYGETHHSLARR